MEELILKIESLEKENTILKQRLSKYTSSQSYKRYYEANKDVINEKKRERQKQAYQKKKEELQNTKRVQN